MELFIPWLKYFFLGYIPGLESMSHVDLGVQIFLRWWIYLYRGENVYTLVEIFIPRLKYSKPVDVFSTPVKIFTPWLKYFYPG